MKKKILPDFIKNLLIILFISSSFIDTFIKYLSQNLKVSIQESLFQEIISFENHLNLSEQIFDEFRKINCGNKLIDGYQKFNKSRNPDVSVIITIHDQANDIHKVLRSVQNQSIKNIEIIIIDDCSLDNSFEILKEYQKLDERIILISHYKNEGAIKSRTDGIRNATGKYITIIDGDDALIHKDILNNCLYIAKKLNIDVVEFRAGEYKNGKFKGIVYDYNSINVEKIIYQPELRKIFFWKKGRYKYTLINRAIWGKFIQNKLFKEILNYIGSEYLDDYINFAEDCIMTVSIFHNAKSYYVMKETGYYYNIDDKNKTIKLKNKICNTNNDGINNFYFNYLKFLVDHHNKNKKEKRSAYHELLILDFSKIFGMNLKKRHYQIIFYVLNKLLEWDCFRLKERKHIISFKNRAIEKIKNDNISFFN